MGISQALIRKNQYFIIGPLLGRMQYQVTQRCYFYQVLIHICKQKRLIMLL